MHADRVADTDVKSHPWHTYSDPELLQKVASGARAPHKLLGGLTQVRHDQRLAEHISPLSSE